MKLQIAKSGAFQGIKLHLQNITVKKWIKDNEVHYFVYRGKGTGGSIFMTKNYDEVLKFDENYKSGLCFKNIYSNKDNIRGGAWFIGEEMISQDHPFIKESGYHF